MALLHHLSPVSERKRPSTFPKERYPKRNKSACFHLRRVLRLLFSFGPLRVTPAQKSKIKRNEKGDDEPRARKKQTSYELCKRSKAGFISLSKKSLNSKHSKDLIRSDKPTHRNSTGLEVQYNWSAYRVILVLW